MASVSVARLALTIRLAEFLSMGYAPDAEPSLLQVIVTVTNELQPLFAAYEQAVLEESQLAVTRETWSEVVDFAEQRMAQADESHDVTAYEDVRAVALKRRADRRA